MSSWGFIVGVAAFLGATVTAYSQESGNHAAGYELAQNTCAECHAIELGDKFSPNILAPAFQDVADTPGMNELALSVWSVTSHPTMPNFRFSQKERADIIAYILSLKTR